MKRPRLLAALAVSALAAAAIGWWLWWPPRPEEPEYQRLGTVPPGEIGAEGTGEVGLWFRPDQVEVRGLELAVLAPEAVLWLESPGELGPVLFRVRGHVSKIVVRSGRTKEQYVPPSSGSGTNLFLEWQPQKAHRYRGFPAFFYRLVVSFPERAEAGREDAPVLALLGTREFLDRDIYGADWRGCGVPEAVAAGEEIPVLARVHNTSPHTWYAEGNARVRLAARWDGSEAEEVRTDLAGPVEPGSELVQWLRFAAPGTPGRHTLELDLVLDPLARFSDQGAGTCRAEVEVR